MPSTSWPADATTIYVGVTSNLVQRVSHHRTRSGPGFTTRYACTRRDRFERYDDTPTAIARENNSKPAPGPANSP
jgi:putative endonuclease